MRAWAWRKWAPWVTLNLQSLDPMGWEAGEIGVTQEQPPAVNVEFPVYELVFGSRVGVDPIHGGLTWFCLAVRVEQGHAVRLVPIHVRLLVLVVRRSPASGANPGRWEVPGYDPGRRPGHQTGPVGRPGAGSVLAEWRANGRRDPPLVESPLQKSPRPRSGVQAVGGALVGGTVVASARPRRTPG